MIRWNQVKLEDICTKITVGHVGSMADSYVESGIPFLRSLNIKPFRLDFDNLKYIDEIFHTKLKKSSLKPNDIVVVRTGYPGTACVIPFTLKDSNCSDLVIIRPSAALNPHFLAAIFNSSFGQSVVSGNLVGAAQQHFNVNVVKQLKFWIPDRKIQDKIVAILSAYDELIENNRRRIALLERMAEEIYREWFVRMRFPGHEHVKVHKGVPEGWEVVKMSSFATYQYGFTESAVDDNSLPKFLRVMDINKSSYIDWANVPNCPISEMEYTKYQLFKHDIIIARMADPGKIAIIEEDIKAVFASYLIRIVYNESLVTP